MTSYYISEASDINAMRRGNWHEAGSLTAAKRIATRAQMFQGSVMRIEDASGRLLASKERGEWTNHGTTADDQPHSVTIED